VPGLCAPPNGSSSDRRVTIWVDAQLSPRTARWIAANFPITAQAVGELGLRDASDKQIFAAARAAAAIVITKDADFLRLLEQRGSPPKVIWLTCGNTSDAALQAILSRHLASALRLLEGGEDLVEIGAP
jgi:predicted nuclease of predicted toxin-antitoxin system